MEPMSASRLSSVYLISLNSIGMLGKYVDVAVETHILPSGSQYEHPKTGHNLIPSRAITLIHFDSAKDFLGILQPYISAGIIRSCKPPC